jgi:cytochrome c peroxidase
MNGITLSWFRKHPFASFALVTGIFAAGLLSTDVRVAKGDGGPGDLAPLSSVSVPTPVGGDIIDQAAAVRLGKAMFWDVQVGGDGQTACATCHFHNGADNRTFSALNPGPDKIFASGGVTGPGQDFSPSNITNDDRVGSPALPQLTFVKVDPNPHNAADICNPGVSPIFGVFPQATTRSAPTTANGLAFFRQMFWDGRGNDTFNGVNPFGATANNNAAATNPALTSISNSALASQAVGPANKFPEVSCNGRTFGNLYDKLTARPALQHQFVHPNDSALGAMSAWPAKGLQCGSDHHACGYGELITAAFGPAMAVKAQFSRVWGQAIQAYESTLIPDQTPLDRFLAGDSKALSDSQKKGLSIFNGKGHCTKCHAGAELSDASVSFAQQNGLINEDGGDQGFHNIGVRPTAEDLGRGGTGGANKVPFSESGSPMDNGAFKTPALRNVKFTAPYFHNGGKATLGDVADFYARGGDFDNTEKARRITGFSMSSSDRAGLVDFLANALTDCRVEKDEAPFDHPSLDVPNGGPSLAATGGGNSCNQSSAPSSSGNSGRR